MRNRILIFLVLLNVAALPKSFSQNVSINSTGSMPDTSAMLDVSSTTKGFLMPRMTTAQRNAIILPATGLTIFNTTSVAYQVNTGTALIPSWSTLNSGAGAIWNLTGNSGTNSGTNFLGTIDNVSLKFKSSGVQRMIVDSAGSIGIGLSPTFTSGMAREKFLLDAGITTSYNAMVVQGSIDSFFQFNIQNLSSGTHSTSDIVATSNNGTQTSNYVDMGINGSNNTSNIFGKSNDAYLYNQGENFFIATSTPSKSLIFMTGGTDSGTNERMRINGSGNIGIGNPAPTEKLDVSGNVKFSGAFMPGNIAGTAGSVLTSNGAGVSPTWTTTLSGTNTGDVTIGTANGLSMAGQVSSLDLASTSATGALSATDWNTFNNKLTTIDTSNIPNFYKKVRVEHTAGTGISYSSTTGVIGNSGVLSLNGFTGAITMDTGYISNFSPKVTSLFSSTAPITYSGGLIGITPATTATSGYLSSTDWNTFNNKQSTLPVGNVTGSDFTITGGTGAIIGSGLSLALPVVNTTPGIFGSTTVIPKLTVNSKGLVTDVSSQTIAFPVTSINTLTGAVSLGLDNLTDAIITTPTNNQLLKYNGTNWVNSTPTYISNAVTTFSASGSQGITASVTNAATTPSLSISLGAITPTSVTAVGAVTGSNLSGANTGDQTIFLTNDVTGSGTGSFATTIGTNKVTYAKMQQATANKLLGNPTGALANVSEIALGTGLSFVGSTLTYTPAATVTSINTLTGAVSLGLDNLTDAIITAPTNNQLLKYNGTSWVNSTPTYISSAVTTFSASGNQGVTASVTNPATTPSLSISLGAITPTSVAAVGAVTGSNLSGANTGDQTIFLTNDVTGSGTGSFATTIGTNKVTYAKMQQATANKLLGNPTGALANVSEITLGTGLSFVGSTLTYTPSGTVTSVNSLTGAVALALDNLTDAIITTPATNQLLKYNGTNWVNSTPTYISSAVTSLDGLTAASQTFATTNTTGTAPAWSAATSIHTLNIPLASVSASVTAGLISNANWTTFNNKQAALSGTGFVKVSGSTISYDNLTYLTANQGITLSGDMTGSGTTAIAATLKTVNSNVGTWDNLTVNAKGLVTAGSNTIPILTVSGTSKLGTAGTVLNGIIHISATITDNVTLSYTTTHAITIPVTGAIVGGNVIVNPRVPLDDGTLIAYSRVKTAGQVEVGFLSSTGSSTLGTMIFDVTVIQ